MSGENEIAVECGLRMVEAPDGVQIPVPSGAVGGVYNEHGGDVSIHPQAPVRISANNGGYYVVVNNTPPANGVHTVVSPALKSPQRSRNAGSRRSGPVASFTIVAKRVLHCRNSGPRRARRCESARCTSQRCSTSAASRS